MNQVNAHKVGLVLGGLLAIVHAIWVFMVFMGLAKPLLDWILGLHFLSLQYIVKPFNLLNGLMLVIITGIIGYVVGYICGWLWNFVHREVHNQ